MRIRPILALVASVAWICCACLRPAAARMPARSHALIELRPARLAAAPGYGVVTTAADTTFYLADTALVSDGDIAYATIDTSAANGLLLVVRLAQSGRSKLRAFTGGHIGERLAVVLDGELNGTPPLIMDTLSGTQWVTVVRLPQISAQRFATDAAAHWRSGQ